MSGSSSLSTEERGQTGPADKRPIRVCPDWICEILSPSTAVRDLVQKRNLYASHRGGLYWFVAVDERTLEAFALESGRWVLVGNYGETGPNRGSETLALPCGAPRRKHIAAAPRGHRGGRSSCLGIMWGTFNERSQRGISTFDVSVLLRYCCNGEAQRSR